jgi:hypothetical protein
MTDYIGYSPTYFKESEIDGLKPEIVWYADKIREKTGAPMTITSGLRVTGGGAHEQGAAIDCRSGSSLRHYALMKASMELGIRRVGVYVKPFDCPHCSKLITSVKFEYGHFHFDRAQGLPNDVLWVAISK